MPTYRVTKKSYLQLTDDGAPRIYKPGAIIEYDGPPGTGMELLDDAAKKRLERARNQRPERSPAEVNTRLDRLEDAVGEDALKAAADKRAAEEQAERDKAAAEQKKADDEAKAKRDAERAAKDEAAKKAAAQATAAKQPEPPASKPVETQTK